MKKIVCSIVIIVIIIFIGDYYNSKYARGVFFEHHFISENIIIYNMNSKLKYYTYFGKSEENRIDKNIMYLLYGGIPACMPIFEMTECKDSRITDSDIIGYSLINNQVTLSILNDSIPNKYSCYVYDEEIKFSNTKPEYNTTSNNLPFIVGYWNIILLIMFLNLIIILMIDIKTYALFFYIFVVLGVFLRLLFDFDGNLWLLQNFFHYIIQTLYFLSLPIMIFRAYKKKEIGIVIPMIILNIILVIYILL